MRSSVYLLHSWMRFLDEVQPEWEDALTVNCSNRAVPAHAASECLFPGGAYAAEIAPLWAVSGHLGWPTDHLRCQCGAGTAGLPGAGSRQATPARAACGAA